MDQNREIEDLRRELRQKDRTIAGMKHYLKIAAEYKATRNASGQFQGEPPYSTLGDELDQMRRQMEGVQAALGKAAAYEGRDRGRGR